MIKKETKTEIKLSFTDVKEALKRYCESYGYTIESFEEIEVKHIDSYSNLLWKLSEEDKGLSVNIIALEKVTDEPEEGWGMG